MNRNFITIAYDKDYTFGEYAYGLTKIKFVSFLSFPFLSVSWISMLPGTPAYVQLGAAVNVGERNFRMALIYLAGARVFIVLVALIPSLIRKREPETM